MLDRPNARKPLHLPAPWVACTAVFNAEAEKIGPTTLKVHGAEATPWLNPGGVRSFPSPCTVLEASLIPHVPFVLLQPLQRPWRGAAQPPLLPSRPPSSSRRLAGDVPLC